jgi:hypothetical protein
LTELAIGETSDDVGVRPAAAYHGRIGDWVQEIREAREAGDRVVFTAVTPGQS